MEKVDRLTEPVRRQIERDVRERGIQEVREQHARRLAEAMSPYSVEFWEQSLSFLEEIEARRDNR